MVKQSKVAVAVAAILAAAMRMNQAEAQEAPADRSTPAARAAEEDLEEVVVTGLRASLQASMDIKRDAIGIVDAITAEDIGKFPDANLSESLQRITGISINRRNGEGAQVTARGFGAEYNMVTLNGRMMPSADAFGGGGNGIDGTINGQSRSFNFANLASDSISGVEVYKTGKAAIATGGIGATINVLTARPFDNAPGHVANFGLKGVNDTTSRIGDEITPEVTGIYSFADDDKRWGVGISGSYQKRYSGAALSTVNDWNVRRWGDGTTPLAPGAQIENAPAIGALYAIPNDIRYHFADRERTRTNGQLTFQFKPTETITLTTDYTYAENELIEDRGDQTMWLANTGFRRIVFDQGEAVATPLLIEEDAGNTKDFGFEQQHREQTSKLKSIGFNAGWQLTDRFNLNLDFHDSKAESLPSDSLTGGGETLTSFAVQLPSVCTPPGSDNCTNRVSQQFQFGSKGLPIAGRTVFSQPTTSAPFSGGDSNFDFTSGDIGSQVLRINYEAQETDITQARLDGQLEFDTSRLQFGVETRAMKSHQQASGGQMTLGDWSVGPQGEIPADLIQAFSLVGEFEDFSATGAPTGGFKGNANAIGLWAMGPYGNWADATQADDQLRFNPGFNQDHVIEEDTNAVYFQFGLNADFGPLPAHLLLGVRYEHTSLDAVSQVLIPTQLIWQDNNDFILERASEFTPASRDFSYSHVLPSLDFDLALRDNVKARFSYSKTIARAQYNQLRSAIEIQRQGAITGSTLLGSSPIARASNPELKPLESDNLDLSLEWYFSDSSYAAAGLFEKRVSNFIGNEIIEQPLFGLRDQTGGQRARDARAALLAGNANNAFQAYAVNDTSLFTMMAMIENAAATGGATAYNGTIAQANQVATDFDLTPRADDPEYIFDVSTPVNNREAKIWGAEFAVQHFFGQSGFGLAANYTIVKGDVGFDNGADPNENQFALLGLSDSANLVAMYEKFGFSVRLAWNWRDEFLQNINLGNFRNPVWVEDYDQVDLNIGYTFTENFAVAFEALNLLEEDVRWHGRSDKQVWYVEDQGARYALGARYKF